MLMKLILKIDFQNKMREIILILGILGAVEVYVFLKKQPKEYAKKNVIKMNILNQKNQMNAYQVVIVQIIILDIIMNV